MKKLKICLVTAGDFLSTALLGVLATWKFFELSDILGPDEIDKDGGEYVSVYVHRFGTGTCLISVTVIAGIISAILVLRLGKTEKMLKIRSINLIILVAITCFWTWYYKEYSFYHNCIYENWDWMEEMDNMSSSSSEEAETYLSYEEREEKMTELVAFCEEHREKLNEMSEFKQVHYFYEGYSNAMFMAVYIEADGEELEVFINDMSTGWIDVRKIDKHLFVVLGSWPYV